MQLYQIHDLVLDYLKDSTPKDKQVSLINTLLYCQ